MGKKKEDPTVETAQKKEVNTDENPPKTEQNSEETAENSQSEAESQSPLEELEAKNAELKDKYMRLMAEFDNYKKRTVREKLDLMGTAASDTLSAILPVMDDFDRAKKTADDDASTEQFSEGVQLVYNKLKSVLQQKGLKEMESTGAVFDPELHEALTKIPAPSEDMKGKIIDTIEKGYFLNDKIIRHAKVVVGE